MKSGVMKSSAMKSTVKRLALVGFTLVVLLLIVGAVVVASFDSERLGQAVLGRASEQLGLDLTAERFDFHLFRGLEIEGLTVRGSLDAGELDGRIERVMLRHDPWPLLSRRVVIHELLIDRPRIELLAGPAAPTVAGAATAMGAEDAAAVPGAAPDPAPASEPSAGGLQLEIHQVRLQDGELLLASTDPAVAPTEVQGLNLALDQVVTVPGAAPGLAALRASGELEVQRARLGELEATDSRSRVSLEDGHLRLTEGQASLEAGEIRALELDLDLNTEPFGYHLAMGADPLRAGRFLAAEGGTAEGAEGTGRDDGAQAEGRERSGAGFGPGRLRFTAQGRGTDLLAMDGDGTLALEGGTLPESPIFLAIDALIEGAGLVGADYQPVDVVFDIGSGRVEIQPFRMVAGGTSLDVRGSAVPGGAWDLWLSLAIPRHGIDIQEIPRELLDILTDETGKVHLPLRVSGTAEQVRVVPDPNALARATREGAQRRLQQEIEKELTRGLQSLFGRDDEGG